ncbi:hypothetical protein LO762_12250 [Actinocorallia sp. API 0066]|uniref:hypothetical protein n=1 Tax=Actinocorallia sp. API 0066 TaxID=2896846 RepID=UPI001E56F155|nr:hypothetical protein [Actinocorallia sp. API 0066]MCD0449956.1 hypothetical protein [Actinocorallia sp. API 0066]
MQAEVEDRPFTWRGPAAAQASRIAKDVASSAVQEVPALGLRLVSALSGYWWLRGMRREGAAAARSLLAMWAVAAGPPTDHAEQIRQMRASSIGDGRPWSRALVELGHGMLHLFEGTPGTARRHLEAALAGFEAIGERWGMATARDTLSVTAELAGDLPGALDLLDGALRLMRELDSYGESADVLLRRADILLRMGRTGAAAEAYAEAEALAARAGTRAARTQARRGRGDLAAARGHWDEAEAHYTAALAECTDHWYAQHLRAECLFGMARVAAARDDRPLARHHAAETITTATGHPLARYLAAEAAALLHELDGPDS